MKGVHPSTARLGNVFGMRGMAVTVFGDAKKEIDDMVNTVK